MTNTDTSSQMTMEFYRKALNFNVIGRYDPKIKQLLFHTPHASIYKWDFTTDEWNKLECQGVLAIYLRDIASSPNDMLPTLIDDSTDTMLNSTNNGTTNNSITTSNINKEKDTSSNMNPTVLTGKDIYNYGLIVLNRINPDNFSLGIVPNSVINKRKLFEAEEDSKNPLEKMGVEVKDDLVIIKNLKHEVYGIWIHTVPDRQNIYELIKYLLENDPKESFA
ncbi:hypothetical protein TBLA_0I00120 [Henningerozyma blattae CBS 6284]|uniref:mRNA-decapping enzyme subunit 1 n=1 Tax=Henningerozyma blattae (strain ATCC 34711 / CBS 6284 / DSM 70876 / NBRC 10599 / NRRL Y-10934 / UCD 77-7) TaxID=1071380 RepID=I2H8H5_HENB6|nr:hypothetical protein TBLA_0I00120 [Tetrapisispora blattae CBS 6284]CCH62677.1 hypothetical protein TBLA_0I00120 [Tetrapisispora blattae CBS 6284]